MEPLSIKAGDELLARVLLQHVLGAVVTQHDDGSAPSMYDLDVAYPDGRRAAAEVVSTRDARAMSLAAATQREIYTDVAALTSTWFVVMRPEAREVCTGSWCRWSVVVGGQGAFDGGADQPVVPDGGVEGEQALDDAGPQAGGDSCAVAFQAELAFEGPDDGLDALA